MTMFRLSRSPITAPSMKLAASAFALICAFGTEGIAHAQQPGTQGAQPLPTPPSAQPCPPGSWFCGDSQATEQSGAKDLQPLPGSEQAPAQNGVTYSGQAPAPPPVVIYQPAPTRPTVVIVNGTPAAYKYTPRPAPERRSEWGLNLHLEGEPISGKGAATNAGMGGLGFGVRYRPSAYAAIEPDLDFVTGTDYNGDHRGEVGFTLNCLIFVNPKSKVQLYFPIGFGWSWAHTQSNEFGDPVAQNSYADYSNGGQHDYSYFGGQAGIGLEFRIAKHFALNTDIRGFVRGRVDSGAQGPNPNWEYTSSDGQHTNTSGGAIVNAGMTFYF
jgi:Outer membrane protein beta-barrel domain